MSSRALPDAWRSHAERNLPRYTSYPTAVAFEPAAGEAEARGWLAATRAGLQLPPERVHELVLAGGDDYELAFCAPPSQRSAVEAAAPRAGTPVTRIGSIDAEAGLRLVDGQGRPLPQRFAGFDHYH